MPSSPGGPRRRSSTWAWGAGSTRYKDGILRPAPRLPTCRWRGHCYGEKRTNESPLPHRWLEESCRSFGTDAETCALAEGYSRIRALRRLRRAQDRLGDPAAEDALNAGCAARTRRRAL